MRIVNYEIAGADVTKRARVAVIETPASEHLAHGVRPVSRRRQLPAFAVGGAKQRRLVVLAGDAGGV